MRAVLLFAIVMLSITMANSQCNYFAKIDNSTDPVFHNLIINAPDSNYIVTWINDSTSTNFVVCIAKIDNNGDTLWTRQIGAGCSGRTINLVNVDSFSFAIAGVSLCKDSNGNPIGGACFLYKMSFNGDSLNITKFSINSTSIKRMIMTRDSNFIVAIDVFGLGDNIFMFDKNFNQIKTFYVPMPYILDVKQGKNGDIVFCGGDNWSNDSWMVASVDSTLKNINWIQNYGSGGGFYGDWFEAVHILPDSNLLVCGSSSSWSSLKLDYNNGSELQSYTTFNLTKMIILSDSIAVGFNWNSIWFLDVNTLNVINTVLGNINNQTKNIVFDMVLNKNGCLTAVGAQYHFGTNKYDKSFFVIFGDTVKLNLGNEEYSTDVELNLSVYPNPSQSKTMVEFVNYNNTPHTYTVTDIQGRIILQGNTNENFIELHKSANPAGVYFVSVRNIDGSVVGRGKILWQ